MSNEFYKVNPNTTVTQKLEQLNDMILALAGKIDKAQFDKNEIDALYTDLGSSYQHKYLRNVVLGNTLATYTGFTHIQAESGYSIWKYTPANYSYDILNKLYFDDKALVNEGLATSETATTFDNVFLFEGSVYTVNTTEAGTEDGTSFDLMNDTSDYLYLGEAATFGGVKFEFSVRGANYTLVGEYWNGASWVELDLSGRAYEDDTSNFESDGKITFSVPDDWATVAVDGVTKYWIRFSTTTMPVTVAEAYYIIPSDSVIGLLAMSSEEFLNEEWKFCSYNGSIYVTIRNIGNSAYEGSYYIRSASSTANKQAFWIDNHSYTADFKDATYS